MRCNSLALATWFLSLLISSVFFGVGSELFFLCVCVCYDACFRPSHVQCSWSDWSNSMLWIINRQQSLPLSPSHSSPCSFFLQGKGSSLPDAILCLKVRTVYNGRASNKQNASCLFTFFFSLPSFILFISLFPYLALPHPSSIFPPTADTFPLTLTLTQTHIQWPSLATLSAWLQHGQLFSSWYVLITKNGFFCQVSPIPCMCLFSYISFALSLLLITVCFFHWCQFDSTTTPA